MAGSKYLAKQNRVYHILTSSNSQTADLKYLPQNHVICKNPQMQKQVFIPLLIFISAAFFIVPVSSCKTVARAAVKYWTKRQVKEFVKNCESKTARLMGEETAAKYCDCAVDVVAEKYRNYNDVKSISILDILEVARGCKDQ